MGWLAVFLIVIATGVLLWRFAKVRGPGLQLLGAGLLVALAGYAAQGRPGLPGRPVPPPARQELPDTPFATMRSEFLPRFDTASRWLTIADHFHRSGDTQSAAEIIRSGLREHPQDAHLWIGMGNALVIHADGLMTPAAELAFTRAAELAPGQPAPRFFYGLALIQSGRFEEGEAVWRELLQAAPPEAKWREPLAQRLAILQQLKAAAVAQQQAMPAQ